VQQGCHLRNGLVGSSDHVQAAGDQVDVRVDRPGCLDDPIDPRMRATHHQHEAVVGADRH
jgi:hypothetical protein